MKKVILFIIFHCSIHFRSVTISAAEYNRLLQNEIQLQKYKQLCEKKAKEMQRIQDKLFYYKNQALKRTQRNHETEPSMPESDAPNVKTFLLS